MHKLDHDENEKQELKLKHACEVEEGESNLIVSWECILWSWPLQSNSLTHRVQKANAEN